MNEKKEDSKNWLQTILDGGWKSVYLGAFLIMIIIGAAEYIFYRLSKISQDEGVEISINPGGSLVWKTSPKSDNEGVFPLPACSGWSNSGLILKPGESIRLDAAGRVCLSIDQLVKAISYGNGKDPQKTPFPWIGPDGLLKKDEGPAMQLLQGHKVAGDRILPGANLGALVCYLRSRQNPPPSIEHNFNPKGTQLVGSNSKVTNYSQEPKELWLTINDIAFDNSQNFLKAKPKSLYWDDNIGMFWVIFNRK